MNDKDSMNDLYEYMKRKHEKMIDEKKDFVSVDYEEFAKLYRLVCYMQQIRTIANGWE